MHFNKFTNFPFFQNYGNLLKKWQNLLEGIFRRKLAPRNKNLLLNFKFIIKSPRQLNINKKYIFKKFNLSTFLMSEEKHVTVTHHTPVVTHTVTPHSYLHSGYTHSVHPTSSYVHHVPEVHYGS